MLGRSRAEQVGLIGDLDVQCVAVVVPSFAMPPPEPALRPSATVRFCSVKAMPESTMNTCTLLPPLIVTTPPAAPRESIAS